MSLIPFYLLMMVWTALCDNDTVMCEPGEEEDCSKCYKVLASSVVYSDKNMFQIQNTFFPPNDESPVFVTVMYEYTDEFNGTSQREIWFWSTSTFYIFQPLNIFQFTSLFFSDTQLLTSSLTLTLPLDCYNASENHKTLLTQRLKLYATRQSITSPIDDEYKPKAMNLSTLKEWHSNHTPYSRFIVANFVVFPLMSWVFLLLLFVYINHFASESRRDKVISLSKRKDKQIAYALRLQDEFILSLFFVALASLLSTMAMIKALHFESELSKEIAKYFSGTSDVEGFRNMYALVIVTLTLDIFIAVVMTFSILAIISINLFLYCKKKYRHRPPAHETKQQGPDLELMIKPQHQELAAPPQQGSAGSAGSLQKIPWNHWWTFYMYSRLFPLCCLANHLNYIIIAFIHDLYHATSVAIVYGVIIIFLSVMLNRLPYVFFKNCMKKDWILSLIFFVKFIAVFVLLGYVTIDILVYFFIPIERAFEDAANHFISIYSTTVVFFTGLIAFFFVRKSFRSQIHIFTKAMDDFFHKNEKEPVLDIKEEDWKKLGTEEKDVEVAKGFLKKIM